LCLIIPKLEDFHRPEFRKQIRTVVFVNRLDVFQIVLRHVLGGSRHHRPVSVDNFATACPLLRSLWGADEVDITLPTPA